MLRWIEDLLDKLKKYEAFYRKEWAPVAQVDRARDS